MVRTRTIQFSPKRHHLLRNHMPSRSTPHRHTNSNAHPNPMGQLGQQQTPHQPPKRTPRQQHQPRNMDNPRQSQTNQQTNRLRPRQRNRLHRPRQLHQPRRHTHTRRTTNHRLLPRQLDRNQPIRPRTPHLGHRTRNQRHTTQLARTKHRILQRRPLHHHHRQNMAERPVTATLNSATLCANCTQDEQSAHYPRCHNLRATKGLHDQLKQMKDQGNSQPCPLPRHTNRNHGMTYSYPNPILLPIG